MQALGSAGGVPDDVVQTLIDELIANADKNVIKMMAKSTVDTFGIGKSGNKAITMQEMQGVKMLREIIEKLDERVNGKSAEKAGDGAVAADGGTASAEGAKAVGDGDGDGDGDAEMADADAEKPAADADGVPDPDGKKRKRSDTTGTSDEQHEKKASKTGEEKGAGGSSDAKMLV